MQNFLAALSGSGFEVVIFDTPSLLGLSDATILASKVDGAIVVVDITNARKGDLTQAKELLEQAGARVLGSVINKQHQGDRGVPYKRVSYSQDAYMANQSGYTNSPTPVASSIAKPAALPITPQPATPVMPKPAAPITPVTWSTPRPQQNSLHGIPPQQPSQNSLHGISPQQKDR
jgi:non-specific protein-tyrosine kinase